MAIYAISDLHLALGVNKPMDVFGDDWSGYMEKIKENWRNTVNDMDTVLLPGDFCWAINLEEADADFAYLADLPGRKIISKGNHDYWWSTKNKIQKWLDSKGIRNIDILHNNAFKVENTIICGTRGWHSPGDDEFGPADMKIYLRELERLKLSLEAGRALQRKTTELAAPTEPELFVMMHYPPLDAKKRTSGFTDILQQYGVKQCIYGHLHDRSRYSAVQGDVDGVYYRLVSADHLRFQPYQLYL